MNKYRQYLERQDFKQIAHRALHQSHTLLSQWLPGGKLVGNEYVVRNPHRTDLSTGSFKVNIRTGAWADFATGDKGGDLIALLAYLNQTTQYYAALELNDLLGGI